MSGIFRTYGGVGAFNGSTRQVWADFNGYSHMGRNYGVDDGLWSFIDGTDNKMYIWVPSTGQLDNGINMPSLSGNRDIDVMLYAALGMRGYQESGNNSTIFGDWYYGGKVSGDNYPWCATFVSWAADQAGIMGSVVPKYEGCWGGRSFYQDNDRLYAAGGDYAPKAGDVFFQGTKHTGLVLAYDPPYVYTIEGNADNQVKVLKRHVSEFTHFGSNGGTSNGIVPTNYDSSGGRTQ